MAYKTMNSSSFKNPNEPKGIKIARISLNIFTILAIIISIVLAIGEFIIFYYSFFEPTSWGYVAPAYIVVLLVIPQIVSIILILILRKWLKTKNSLDDRSRKLSLAPLYLSLFNSLLAITLTLIVNIHNGNIASFK